MDSHEALRQSLSEYRDGELAPEAARAVDSHLAGCASCREELALMDRAARAFLRAPEARLSEGFAARVLAEAGYKPAPAADWVLGVLDGWAGPAVALGLAVAAGVAILPSPQTAEAQAVASLMASADGGVADWAVGEGQDAALQLQSSSYEEP